MTCIHAEIHAFAYECTRSDPRESKNQNFLGGGHGPDPPRGPVHPDGA